MSPILSLLFLLSLSGLSYAHTWNRNKYNKKALVDIQATLVDLTAKVEALKLTVAQLQECVNTPVDDENREEKCPPPPGERSSLGTTADVIWAASMYLSNTGDRCGPQILTGCTRTIDAYASGTENAAFTTNTYTITGTCFFSAPVAGYYNICFHARFKNSGNSNDVTIAAGSQQYAAAFGDADTRDWRSTGTCFIYSLTAGQQVYAWARHGGSSDCVQETSWRYGVQSVYLIAATT